jgi:RNase P/RNase MRP subunit p30
MRTPRTVEELAAQLGVTVDQAEDYVLAHAPEFIADRERADADPTAGATVDLEAVLAELDEEELAL